MRKRGCCKIVYFAAPYLFVIKTNVIVQLLQALLYIQTAVARANWEAAHNMFPCSITLRLEVTWKKSIWSQVTMNIVPGGPSCRFFS